MRWLFAALAPIGWLATYVAVACGLARLHRRAIAPGRFRRDVATREYFHRRLFGLLWTALYYFKPLYFLLLSFPLSRGFVFRSFGYRGPNSFAIYPDSWIRDPPLLSIGRGAYVANRATLGTNMPTRDGGIIVEGIEIGDASYIGHLVMVGPGCRIGRGSEIAAGAALNLKVEVGDDVKIGPLCGLDHYAQIGDRTTVGGGSSIGKRAVVGPDLELPPRSHVPDGMKVMTQEDADRLNPWVGRSVLELGSYPESRETPVPMLEASRLQPVGAPFALPRG